MQRHFENLIQNQIQKKWPILLVQQNYAFVFVVVGYVYFHFGLLTSLLFQFACLPNPCDWLLFLFVVVCGCQLCCYVILLMYLVFILWCYSCFYEHIFLIRSLSSFALRDYFSCDPNSLTKSIMVHNWLTYVSFFFLINFNATASSLC